MAVLVKTLNGLAFASVKARSGLAVASIKSINGLDVTAAGPSYLVEENFEATGATEYDNTPTEAGTGTIDGNYATSPAPLQGSESLRLAMASQNGNVFWPFTGTGDVWAYFQVNFTTRSPSGKVFFSLNDSSGNNLLTLELSATNTVRIRVGSANTTTTDAVDAATTYHFRVRYTKGTGANAYGELEFSTTGAFAGSGNKYANRTTGSSTADAARAYFGSGGNATWEGIFDRLLVSSSVIGNNP